MTIRLFKTKRFRATAQKASISDTALVAAVNETLKGQADNLGGGVWKKRLNANHHRSIILARGWVYQFLFAKQDQSNISAKELDAFRQLAKAYEGLSDGQIQQLLDRQEFVEMGHE